MSNNVQRLGETLAARMKKTSSAAIPTTIELGTINSNMSLTTDSLQAAIPAGDYMVDILLASSSYSVSITTHTHAGGTHTQEKGSGYHTHDGGEHSHRLPGNFRALQPGDRVLVAWCGNDPVVIAIVTGKASGGGGGDDPGPDPGGGGSVEELEKIVQEILEKLDTIEENAQENKLEAVKRNGEALPIDDQKTVDVAVPEKVSELTNDAGYINDLEALTNQDLANILT